MKILGIETSCDETAAAVVEDGRSIVSNVVATQAEMHAEFGGIVPEVAARQHLVTLLPVVTRALEEAETDLGGLDGIAVTHGPGLAGALLVGVNSAKGLALAKDVSLIGVNHLEGHVYAAWLDGDDPEAWPGFPLVCLIASGGHTDLLLMEGHGQYTLVGRDAGRRRGRGVRQGRPAARPGVPGRAGDPASGRRRQWTRAAVSPAANTELARLQLQRSEDRAAAPRRATRVVPESGTGPRRRPAGRRRCRRVPGGPC